MKKTISMIMMVMMMVCMIPIVDAADYASGSEEANYYSDAFSWRIDSDWTLYIDGNGVVNSQDTPWSGQSMKIENVIVGEGVTEFPAYMFGWLTNVKTFKLPSSLMLVGATYEDVNFNREDELIVGDFYLSQNVEFIVPAGSYAEDYVKRMGYDYTYSDQTASASVQEPVQKNTVTTSFGATVSDWAAPEIELAYESGLIPEVMVDFDFTQKVNRGEFAAIALQLYDVLENTETPLPASCPFTDIAGDVNEIAIKKAAGLDITNGTSPNLFEPLSNITREQLATMLCRVMKKHKFEGWTLETDDDYYLNTNGAVKFADDAEISDWAKPSVYFMSLYGIVKGVDETHFAPKNTTTQQEASGYATATREQALIMSKRIYDKADML